VDGVDRISVCTRGEKRRKGEREEASIDGHASYEGRVAWMRGPETKVTQETSRVVWRPGRLVSDRTIVEIMINREGIPKAKQHSRVKLSRALMTYMLNPNVIFFKGCPNDERGENR
jgi:hypothetical protein